MLMVLICGDRNIRIQFFFEPHCFFLRRPSLGVFFFISVPRVICILKLVLYSTGTLAEQYFSGTKGSSIRLMGRHSSSSLPRSCTRTVFAKIFLEWTLDSEDAV
ncbi:hypothetical protein RvY_07689 [Ramazzottius varieornatus]|uniref:Uncharacterized protein n=1 Tax=Ramazzottius varieornatus TaxID=947166 RepID=A0A1D1VBG2_RAMVA|nr:hypothetical protein RvY_07689 [Ramazzottius varieornatus]